MYNLHIRITEEQNKRLISVCKKLKMSKAEVMRALLGEVFETKKLSTGKK